MKTLLHLQDLVKSFDHQIVLNHVSFELQPGEIIGLIGPSGADVTISAEGADADDAIAAITETMEKEGLA